MQPKLKMIAVIPCLAEEGIWATVESLRNNSGYHSLAQAIIVVNHSEFESEENKAINRKTLLLLKNKLPGISSDRLSFEVIEALDLPAKNAGVGLARKTGMERAIEKLKEANTFNEGVIVCLDGDCTVATNYLAEIEKYFEAHNANGCSIYFEHPLGAENADAIVDYELYLRYYTNALRWCGFPFAFQTVGSSMAVSAKAYVKQGGMNTRKAGEDFYFLNKIIQLGKFGDLTSTTVFPSSRKSDRVPFGTGREMTEWEINKKLLVYSPILFGDLKTFFSVVDDFRDQENPLNYLEGKVNDSFLARLKELDFNENIKEIKTHTASPAAFRKRFFVWMNAFRIMKLLNELNSTSVPGKVIFDSASWLWNKIDTQPLPSNTKNLLTRFREFDRTNPKWFE